MSRGNRVCRYIPMNCHPILPDVECWTCLLSSAGGFIDDLDPAVSDCNHPRNGTGETPLLTLTDEDLLKALHLITDVFEINVPTIAGMLLLGDEERLLQLLPAAQTAFQVFNGTELRVNRISHKPILTLMDNCSICSLLKLRQPN